MVVAGTLQPPCSVAAPVGPVDRDTPEIRRLEPEGEPRVIHVSVLGPVEVLTQADEPVVIGGRRPASIVAALAFGRGCAGLQRGPGGGGVG